MMRPLDSASPLPGYPRPIVRGIRHRNEFPGGIGISPVNRGKKAEGETKNVTSHNYFPAYATNIVM